MTRAGSWNDAPMPVLATSLAAGLLVLAGYVGPGWLAVTVVGLVVLLAYGLLIDRDLPERVLAGVLIVLTAVGAVAAVLATHAEPGAETAFGPVLRAVGPALVAMLLVVLARPKAREHAVRWLAAAGSGIVLAGLAGAGVALGRPMDLGPELVAIMAGSAVVGSAVVLPPIRRLGWLWSLGWLVGGAIAAYALPTGLIEPADRAVLAVAVAIAAGIGSAAVGARSTSESNPAQHWSARSGLVAFVSLAVAAPVAATVARVLLA